MTSRKRSDGSGGSGEPKFTLLFVGLARLQNFRDPYISTSIYFDILDRDGVSIFSARSSHLPSPSSFPRFPNPIAKSRPIYLSIHRARRKIAVGILVPIRRRYRNDKANGGIRLFRIVDREMRLHGRSHHPILMRAIS